MLLFGENREVSPGVSGNAAPRGTSTPRHHHELRVAFEKLAAAFARIRPNPAPADVALLVEWLAEREFGSALASNGGEP